MYGEANELMEWWAYEWCDETCELCDTAAAMIGLELIEDEKLMED